MSELRDVAACRAKALRGVQRSIRSMAPLVTWHRDCKRSRVGWLRRRRGDVVHSGECESLAATVALMRQVETAIATGVGIPEARRALDEHMAGYLF